MAHFYASIQGNRAERTCMGTKDSGIEGHIRGWDIGASVDVRYNAELDRDEVTVCLTRGSNGGWLRICQKYLGTFTLNKKSTSYKRIK